MPTITKVSSVDVANANDWLGYKQEITAKQGDDLELTIPVPRSQIRELSISVVHDALGNFMSAASSQELVIPIDKLVLNHKFIPNHSDNSKNTMVYLSTETNNSLTIKFNALSTNYYTGGKVSWR